MYQTQLRLLYVVHVVREGDVLHLIFARMAETGKGDAMRMTDRIQAKHAARQALICAYIFTVYAST